MTSQTLWEKNLRSFIAYCILDCEPKILENRMVGMVYQELSSHTQSLREEIKKMKETVPPILWKDEHEINQEIFIKNKTLNAVLAVLEKEMK